MADDSARDAPTVAATTTAAEAALDPVEANQKTTVTDSLTDDVAASTAHLAENVSATGTGTSTPIVELDPQQRAMSLRVSLADLSAKGAALYGQRRWEEAAEMLARASEMQAEMRSEMDPENAEILFLYGRALFKVGQSKSDVLGGKAPDSGTAAEKKKKKAAKKQEPGAAVAFKVEMVVEDKNSLEKNGAGGKKSEMFHFEGDENFEAEDEDEEEANEDEEEDGEDDDLATAFEVLDLARILFEQKLDSVEVEAQGGKGKDANPGDSLTNRHVKERLADTHDLLAEISLENERFSNAITDSRASLKYKKQLYTQESEVVAEAHFKLSLALEFASVTTSKDDANEGLESHVMDQSLRNEAAVQLEAALVCTKLKLQNKEVELATLHSPEDNDLSRKEIAELKEIVADMEQRLVELKKPPLDITEALGAATGVLLGSALGESAEKAALCLHEANKNANDLTSLVRKRRKSDEEQPSDSAASEPKKPKMDEAETAKTVTEEANKTAP